MYYIIDTTDDCVVCSGVTIKALGEQFATDVECNGWDETDVSNMIVVKQESTKFKVEVETIQKGKVVAL